MKNKIRKIFIFLTFVLFPIKSCPDDSYCMECEENFDKEFICKTCQYSILDIAKNFCVPVIKPIQNCVIYNSVSVLSENCIECEWGFGLDEHGQCLMCSQEDCAVCNGENCHACFNGFLVIQNYCAPDYNCESKYCDICDKVDHCLRCKNGYALLHGVCIKSVENCLEGNNKICSKCDKGYYVDNKKQCKKYKEMIPILLITKFLIYALSVVFVIFLSYFIYTCVKKEDQSKIEKLIQ